MVELEPVTELSALARGPRSEQGRHLYRKRKAIVEPVFGVLKQQRNLREFRLRSLDKVAIEFALAATAYNLTRIHRSR